MAVRRRRRGRVTPRWDPPLRPKRASFVAALPTAVVKHVPLVGQSQFRAALTSGGVPHFGGGRDFRVEKNFGGGDFYSAPQSSRCNPCPSSPALQTPKVPLRPKIRPKLFWHPQLNFLLGTHTTASELSDWMAEGVPANTDRN